MFPEYLENRMKESMSTTGMVIKAMAFAADKHRNQRRKDADASPYINHPIALAHTLVNEGSIEDPDVLCAAVLHDTIEDTETTADELKGCFGEKITSIVLEVTDDMSLAKQTRKQLQIKHAPLISPEAKLVKLADKICNLRDIISSPPANWSEERKQEYFDWAAQVVAGIQGVNSRLEAIFYGLYERQAGTLYVKP
jgi:guanosine-3',5'-bis(diphosphate) 3'-pyrophosphohydrolase